MTHTKNMDKEYIKKVVALEQDRLKKISEITELTDFFFKDELEYDKELLRWKDTSDEESKATLENLAKALENISEEDFTKEKMEPVLKGEAERAGGNGQVFWPMRVALSGKKASPGPLEIAEVLGKEKSLERIKTAMGE